MKKLKYICNDENTLSKNTLKVKIRSFLFFINQLTCVFFLTTKTIGSQILLYGDSLRKYICFVPFILFEYECILLVG